MYEYNKTRAGLGATVRVGAKAIGPYSPGPYRGARPYRPYAPVSGMGWTGGFTIPGDETRFSMRSCSGSAAMPMSPTSDMICGRAGETSYLNRIGCTAVGFRGSHHCLTSPEGNQGVFFCCPPGVLDRELASRGAASAAAVLPSGAALGIMAVAGVGLGLVLWDMKRRRDEEVEPWHEYGPVYGG